MWWSGGAVQPNGLIDATLQTTVGVTRELPRDEHWAMFGSSR